MEIKMDQSEDCKVSRGVRDATFDLAKFIVILMVILWHCYPAGWHATGRLDALPPNLIIGCNMPIFFMISGYFSRKMHFFLEWKTLAVRLVGYLWPVFVFSILDVVALALHNSGEFCLQKWVHILMFCFWFFFCLSLCEVTTFFAFWIARRMQVIVYAVLGLVFLIFWSIPLGMYYYVAMVPFYWFELFLLPYFYNRKNVTYFGLILLVVYIVVSILEGDITANGLGFYWDRMRLCNPSCEGLIRMLLRYVIGLVGALGLLFSVKSLVRAVPWISKLSVLGTTTLGVYFLHRYFVMEYNCIVGSSSVGAFVFCGLSMGIFAVCHLVVVLTKRWRWIDCAFWGPRLYVKAWMSKKRLD